MLVLGRAFGQELIIRGPGLVAPITIAVLGTQGGKIRIGIDAPRTMSIIRKELIGKYEVMKSDVEAKEAAERENSSR
jgi:carbon storage regulator CsrA